MQQEDDLRALAKIMDFLRAVSIILVVMNVYWYCYATIEGHGINIGVVDRILLNFNREAGLFHSILYTKLFALLLLALSCLGTKGVINEKITWPRIWAVLGAGVVFYFIINWWMLLLPIHADVVTVLYILTIAIGYICLMMAGLWMSRLLKHHLMEDVFNNENESAYTIMLNLNRTWVQKQGDFLDNFIATARSNKVAVCLGFQDFKFVI